VTSALGARLAPPPWLLVLRAVDGHTATVGGGLGRDLGRLSSGRVRLSLEASYDQYRDRVSPAGSSQAAYGFARLAFSAF